jgi:hypothetical protein
MQHKPESDPESGKRELHLAPRRDKDSDDDGTRQLLHGGGWTFLAGLLAAAATQFLFGGIGRQGPHTNSGWLSLIVALNCLPFGLLLFLLGFAKWLRNRSLRKR